MPKNWTTVRTSAPANPAVSLSEVKAHLRLAEADTSQDNHLELLRDGAVEKAQRDVRRQFVSCGFRQDSCSFDEAKVLWFGPVSSITKVEYLDQDGNSQTVDPSVYQFDAGRGQLKLAFGKEWPDAAQDSNAVSVSYVAGYGSDSGCVPRSLKQAALLLVADSYYNPTSGNSVSPQNLNAYDSIINSLLPGIYP